MKKLLLAFTFLVFSTLPTEAQMVNIRTVNCQLVGAITTPGTSDCGLVTRLLGPTFTAIATGQQAVTSSAVALPSSAGKLVCLRVKAGGTQIVYFGPSGVTTANGQELNIGDSYCETFDNANRIFVIAAGSGSTVAWHVLQ